MDKKIKIPCPYCGCTYTVKGLQMGQGCVVNPKSAWMPYQKLYHEICVNCGSVVRSYVEEPKKFMKK